MRSTQRLSFLALLAGTAAMGACSLINSPDEVHPGGSGGTGGSSSSTMGECTKDSDCTADACETAECKNSMCVVKAAADGASCDDGSKCTTGDKCQAGKCTGTAKTCNPPADPCHASTCNPASGACEEGPGNDGAACEDNDPCTDEGVCQGGTCMKGEDACMRLATECIDATCVAGVGCMTTNKLNLTPCGQTFCSNGQCNEGHCDITPVNEGQSCDDGLFCVINETCQFGFCIGEPNPCPTGNQCIAPGCDEVNKACTATPIPDNSPCDDGDGCSANEFCSTQGGNSVCTGGLPSTTLFFDNFANGNAAGWTLGPEWQIAQAATSPPGQFNPDPALDYDGDGFVAGVAIGGNAFVAVPPADPIHPLYYITSPVINTNIAGSVYLSFYRFLNSDYLPYMHNTVEASPDGVNWTIVWESEYVATFDDAWTFVSYDITAFKSATMQFRMGFEIGSQGVYTVSSWNIDHVKVQNAPCPQ